MTHDQNTRSRPDLLLNSDMYNRSMKKLLVYLFDKTFGRIVRQTQQSLILNKKLTLQSAIHDLSITDSANYVYQTMTQAVSLQTRQEIWAYSLARPSLIASELTPPTLSCFGIWSVERRVNKLFRSKHANVKYFWVRFF